MSARAAVVLSLVVLSSAPAAASAHVVLHVRPYRTIRLHVEPRLHAPVLQRVHARDLWSRRTALGVVARRAGWYGVSTATRRANRIGWVRAAGGNLTVERTGYAIAISRAHRHLVLLHGPHVLMRVRVSVGAPATPTPAGRFAVTDLLPGRRWAPGLGCCVLVLSARQPRPPPWWDPAVPATIALHGGSVGAASAGCVHVPAHALRRLFRTIPPGTRVTIS
jgi:hypothetical protein